MSVDLKFGESFTVRERCMDDHSDWLLNISCFPGVLWSWCSCVAL